MRLDRVRKYSKVFTRSGSTRSDDLSSLVSTLAQIWCLVSHAVIWVPRSIICSHKSILNCSSNNYRLNIKIK
uniref:Uncharacterized protein n=1 Tax=Kalanchoe fedtschenkoi TaxID=63787 RepID=A0A7N0U0K8_KALFE